MRSQGSHTKLQNPWLSLARMAWWVVTLLSLGLLFIGTWDKFQAPLPENCEVVVCNPIEFTGDDAKMLQSIDLPNSLFSVLLPLINILFNVGFVLVGLFLGWRKSDDWFALLLSGTFIILGGVAFSPANDVLHRTRPGLGAVANWLQQPAYTALILILTIFPDGSFVPRWTKLIIIPASLLAIVPYVSADLSIQSSPERLIPFYIISLVGISVIQVYRYRKVAGPLQRQQAKWGLLGVSAAFLIMFSWVIVATFFPPTQPSGTRTIVLLITWPLLVIVGLLVPLSFAVAVMRYRLWDIDLIIRRTLSYALLTGILVLIYFGAVVVTQSIFQTIVGDPDTPLITIISTLTIAALFSPLRVRIQDFIDRRFFRQKYNAERALAQFAATARDEVNVAQLSAELFDVLEETMQPKRASLWLKVTSQPSERRSE